MSAPTPRKISSGPIMQAPSWWLWYGRGCGYHVCVLWRLPRELKSIGLLCLHRSHHPHTRWTSRYLPSPVTLPWLWDNYITNVIQCQIARDVTNQLGLWLWNMVIYDLENVSFQTILILLDYPRGLYIQPGRLAAHTQTWGQAWMIVVQ